ncbi:MAG TPA: hypothetical protein VND65_14325, partial [Candidatus Binatia bacterium]|nr:hypothetical protein [Candidatus Binatia bacterium]
MKRSAPRVCPGFAIFIAGLLPFAATWASAQAPAYSTIPARSPQAMAAAEEQAFAPAGGFGPNVNVTNETGAQSETSVAVDPTNPMHVIQSVNDLTSTAAVYESTDGGATWTNTGLPTNGAFCYDTWDSFDTAGNAFVSFQCFDQRIAYKLAGTSTWVATTLSIAGVSPDRDMVAVDNNTGSP